MNALVRADASYALGVGHVMRCLALAEALIARGLSVHFVSRTLPAPLRTLVEQRGGQTQLFSAAEELDGHWTEDALCTEAAAAEIGTADWLIVDHYELPIEWERRLRRAVRRILVIEDLLDRRHDCDLLLVPNLYPDPEQRFALSAPQQCRRLLGPRFALVRSEFRRLRQSVPPRTGHVQRLFVGFGGSDPTRETVKALDALRLLHRPDIIADVVVGPANEFREAVHARTRELPGVRLHDGDADVAKLMASADLAIGAAGSMTWERCCLGLTALVLAVAPNQVEIARSVAAVGAAVYLGTPVEVTSAAISDRLQSLLNAPAEVKTISDAARTLVDGEGTRRVADAMVAP